jgi:hypothetical protein
VHVDSVEEVIAVEIVLVNLKLVTVPAVADPQVNVGVAELATVTSDAALPVPPELLALVATNDVPLSTQKA